MQPTNDLTAKLTLDTTAFKKEVEAEKSAVEAKIQQRQIDANGNDINTKKERHHLKDDAADEAVMLMISKGLSVSESIHVLSMAEIRISNYSKCNLDLK
jgi:hypothetical protein